MSNIKLKRLVGSGLAALFLAIAGGSAMAGASGTQSSPASSASAEAPTTQAQLQAAFDRNMQTMRAQMMQLRATHDPATRAKLLDEHMRTMQETLHMMMGQRGARGAGMGPGMMQSGGMGPGMRRGGGMGGGMMGNGQMMQMMMGQMMQHQQAMQSTGCPR